MTMVMFLDQYVYKNYLHDNEHLIFQHIGTMSFDKMSIAELFSKPIISNYEFLYDWSSIQYKSEEIRYGKYCKSI